MNKRDRLKISLGITFVAILFAGCKQTSEKVIATWPDGSPQIVYIMKGKDKQAVKIAERRYYENGQLQCEKHYDAATTKPDGTWVFYYDNGQRFAEGHFDANHPMGKDWKLLTHDGVDYAVGCDSLRVSELGDAENPATIFFYRDSTLTIRQFYSTGALRSEGNLINGLREGPWHFLFANGTPQTEATFIGGKENGTYTVYRENGVPFYRGQYKDGHRIGTWELYDEDANLVSTQKYEE